MDTDTGQDKCSHDGVLLRKAAIEHATEFETTGCLNLVYLPNPDQQQPPKGFYAIEWRPNDGYLISDTDTQGEWSLVDTIARRNRTASECLIFDSPPSSGGAASGVRSSLSSSPSQAAAPVTNGSQGPTPVVKRSRNIRARFCDLKQIEVLRRGQTIRLISRDKSVHSEYLFQNGNTDNFLRALTSTYLVEMPRLSGDRITYDVKPDEGCGDREKLKKTFAELQIDDIKPATGWISNMVRRPYEQTMDMFSKIAVYGNIHANQSSSSSSSSPSATSSPIKAPATGPATQASSPISTPYRPPSATQSMQSGSAEDYEVLGASLNRDRPFHSPIASNLSSRIIEQLQEAKEMRMEARNRLPERKVRPRGPRLTKAQWLAAFSADGSITTAMALAVRQQIFRGGIEPEIRADVWKYLLGYDLWSHTDRERAERRERKSAEYATMKSQWQRMSTVQENNFSDYRDRKCQIEKDVSRTDRTLEFFAGDNNPNLETLNGILMTYVMYNFDLGYVQGMSDLLAPILCVMQDEKAAFWCFVGFMERVYRNFDTDQAGTTKQLQDLHKLLAFVSPRLFRHLRQTQSDTMFFCFRWILVWFKREFSLEDINTMWEVLWTGQPCSNYHLFVSVAILDEQTDRLIGRSFEEILKHINELNYRIDLDATLARAEAIYEQVMEAKRVPHEIRVIMGQEVEDDNGGAEDSAELGLSLSEMVENDEAGSTEALVAANGRVVGNNNDEEEEAQEGHDDDDDDDDEKQPQNKPTHEELERRRLSDTLEQSMFFAM